MFFGSLQVDIEINENLSLERLSVGDSVNQTANLDPTSAVSYFRSLETAFSAHALLCVWVSFTLSILVRFS